MKITLISCEGAVGVHVGVGEQPQLFELVGSEQVGLVEHDHDVAAAFVFLGGEQFAGLRDQACFVEARGAPEGGDDPGVETARPDGGVGLVDDGGAAGIQAGQGGPDGDGLAGADLTGDDTEGPFGQAPADPGDGFGVGGVAVQHLRGQRPAERHLGEAVMGLQILDRHRCPWLWWSLW